MGSPHTLGDTMREHDKAVYDWLGGLLIDYGDVAGARRNQFPILRVAAAPDQAFASVVDLLVHLSWLPGDTADKMRAAGEDQWPQLPLPVATIERDEPVKDNALETSATMRRLYLNPETGQWEYHRWPAHYLTTYRVTFWSVKKATDAFIREWVYSQLGAIGNTPSERMLTVTHPLPWGPTLHKFSLEGSLNLSALEGDARRLIRTEFSFTLRTLVFFPPVGAYYLTHGVQVDAATIDRGNGVDNTDETALGNATVPAGVAGAMTDNLFYFPVRFDQIADTWPVTGAAKALPGGMTPAGAVPGSFGDYRSLRALVSAPGDTVELLERLVTPDADGRGIVSVSFAYQCAGAPVELQVGQRAAPADSTLTSAFARELPLARRWQPVHVFTVVSGTTFQAAIAGSGAPGDATVAEVDVRQVMDGARVAPAAVTSVGGTTRYVWTGLDTQPYLIIVVLTPGNTPGPVAVTAADDATAPAYTATQSADPAVNVGLAFLIQPSSGSIALSVPSTLALDTAYLQRYAGPYNGSSV